MVSTLVRPKSPWCQDCCALSAASVCTLSLRELHKECQCAQHLCHLVLLSAEDRATYDVCVAEPLRPSTPLILAVFTALSDIAFKSRLGL